MLYICSLCQGAGSMDYIHNLLIMEDDLDDEDHADNRTGDTEIFGCSRHSRKWS